MMKRIKIRYVADDSRTANSGSNTSKVLRFDESIEFNMLIAKIVAKLGVSSANLNRNNNQTPLISEQFELWLGYCAGNNNSNSCLLEETDEIDDGDEILLKKKKKKDSNLCNNNNETTASATPSSREYNTVIPFTTDGLLLNIGMSTSEVDDDNNNGTPTPVFLGYRLRPGDGSKGPSETNQLVRHVGDKILAVNGVSTLGKPFEQVLQMFQKQGEEQKFIHVRFQESRTRNNNSNSNHSIDTVGRPERLDGSAKETTRKKNDDSGDNATENDSDSGNSADSSVEDVTEQVQRWRSARKKKEKIVELLSSGEEDDDDDGDDDEDSVKEDDSSDGSIAEGSDAWDDDECSSASSLSKEDSDDSDYDEEEEDKKPSAKASSSLKKRKAKSKPPESPLQVFMDEKDIPAAPGKRESVEEQDEATTAPGGRSSTSNDDGMEEVSTLVSGAGRKKADRAVKDRIIKLLNTGFHDQSNENEAKNAMKLAQRLMHKHNLTQALLLKERQEQNEKEQGSSSSGDEILKGGSVTVRIEYRKTGKPALFARWLSNLTGPVTDNFDVKCYHTTARGRKCSVTFYGIYTNAQLAGYAYKVAAERIAQMAAVYTPEKQTAPSPFWWRSSRNDIGTKSSRLSYAMGVVKGISKDVENNIKLEKERRLRKLARARLAASTGEAYEESDDDDQNGNDDSDDDDDKEGTGFSISSPTAENDDHDKKPAAKVSTVHSDREDDGEDDNTPHSRAPKQKVDIDRRLDELEKEEQAAIVLVDHREKIAEQVLEEKGIKLSKGRKRKAMSIDRRSFSQGIEDSKEIDINQRAIRDEVKVKKERKR